MQRTAVVRQAAPRDVRALAPLIAEYWRFEGISGFDERRVTEVLDRLLSEPAYGSGWIAIMDDHLVGYLLAVYVFSLEHLGLTAEIDEFFVLPSHRNNSVGMVLLGAAESEFRRVGCTNVSLQLSRKNDKGRAFYRRQGYAERSDYELLDKMLS